MQVVCKLVILVSELGCILWTGTSEHAIKEAAQRKYAGHTLSYGEPRYVLNE